MKLFNIFVAVVSACLFIVGNAQAKLPSGISISLEPTKSSYSASDSLLLKVRYTNESNQTISFLKWGTAAEGRVDADFLQIQGVFGITPYTGRHYKRAAPTPADYISIQAKQYAEFVVDISDGYALDSAGSYQVSYRADEVSAAAFKSSAIADLVLSETRPILSLKRTPTTQSCVGSRPGLIDSAVSAAESITRRARDDMQNTPVSLRPNAERYKEWFGSYSAGRWNTVQDHFNKIYSAVSGRVLNFICDDASSAFAYVFPSQPYNIYLGQAFWNAPRTGTDSKAGTIVHELSHFTVLGGTDDHVYGQSGARSLAVSNPTRATQNADSHEYFAENTPSLSMPPPQTDFPDLVIGSQVFSELNPRINQKVTVDVVVNNQGQDVSAATTLVLSLSNEFVSPQVTQVVVPSIAAGASANIQFVFTAPSAPGSYSRTLCVSSVPSEANSGNNCSSPVQMGVKKGVPFLAPIIDLITDD